MSESTLVVVMAHAEAQATYDRHYRFWKAHDCDMLVVCPQDSVVQTKEQVLAIGRRSHHGEEANARFLSMLSFLEAMDYFDFIVHEYDSLCIDPDAAEEFPLTHGSNPKLRGNRWDNTEPNRFHGKHYFHPPLSFGKEVLKQLNQAALKVHPRDEEGFWDRLVGWMADIAGLETGTWGDNGFSRNTIEPEHLLGAVSARRNGAVWLHGIKDARTLHALEHAKQ